MNFPKWAPSKLVEHHRHLSPETPRPKIRISNDNLVYISNDDLSEIKKLIDEELPKWVANNKDETRLLLEKYLTDNRMKEVWTSLNKRTKDDKTYIRFLHCCQRGKSLWNDSPKLTKTDVKNHYNEIYKTAKRLQDLINKYNSYEYEEAVDHIDDEFIEQFLKSTFENYNELTGDDLEEKLNDAIIEIISLVTPIDKVLKNIMAISKENINHPPVVLQPNSPNAHIHFFVKTLSKHMVKEYGQRLDKIVAITTEVTFDLEYYNENTVKRIMTS